MGALAEETRLSNFSLFGAIKFQVCKNFKGNYLLHNYGTQGQNTISTSDQPCCTWSGKTW